MCTGMRPDMCTDMCTGMCAGMLTDMHTDICTDMCTGMCTDMCTGMRPDMCTGMHTDMRTDMCTDMCADMCADICGRLDPGVAAPLPPTRTRCNFQQLLGGMQTASAEGSIGKKGPVVWVPSASAGVPRRSPSASSERLRAKEHVDAALAAPSPPAASRPTLYIGIADGVSTARVWPCRYSK